MENNHPLNPLIRSRAARVQSEESQTLLPCVRATPDLCGSRKVASLEAREVSPMSAEGVGRLDAATASPSLGCTRGRLSDVGAPGAFE